MAKTKAEERRLLKAIMAWTDDAAIRVRGYKKACDYEVEHDVGVDIETPTNAEFAEAEVNEAARALLALLPEEAESDGE